ncbi:MAG TPA: hypothetical protein VGO50_00060 [Pyrinomonadaceae bacterium]|jgi:hypothetical protein|nr:hypothetical protein [Pyrinomonadaceae bacterium]
MKRKFLIIFSVLLFSSISMQAQTRGMTKAEAREADGVNFGMLDGIVPVKWKNFRGTLLREGKKPSGMFIVFQNEGESLDTIRSRAGKAIAGMFIKDDKKVDDITWQTKSLPAHEGDKENTAIMNIYDGDAETIQVVYYVRERKNAVFVYGYFARKSKTSKKKSDSGDFMDENGEGIKIFDKFWRSFY